MASTVAPNISRPARFAEMDREFKSIELWRCVITECLATFFYVFLPCLALLNWQPNVFDIVGTTSSDLVYVAMAFGFTQCTLTQCFGHISGGHMNPAITMATMVTCKISPLRGVLYMLGQLGGGIAGAALLYGITPSLYRGTLGVTSLHQGVSPVAGFGLELLLTFTLVMTYCATTDPNRRNHGNQSVPMGFTVALLHLVGYRVTGSNCNPARSLGPAFLTNIWQHHWIYWAGPVAGGLVAGILYEYIFDPFRKTKKMEEVFTCKGFSNSTHESAHPTHVYGFGNCGSQRGSFCRTGSVHRPRGLENSAYESATLAREHAQAAASAYTISPSHSDTQTFDNVFAESVTNRSKY